MAERVLDVDGVRLAVDTFGAPGDPPLLLVAGGAQSMVWWEDDFCADLAAGGRHVVRYDHRDTGRSTTWPAGQPTYTGRDLVDDQRRVLDGLGLGAAHVVGLSMGGALAQCLAVTAPGRVRTLTLVSTTPVGPYDGPPLPAPEPRVLSTPPEPDPGDRAALLEHRVAVARAYAGTLPFDEPRVRGLAARELARTSDHAAAGNHFLVGAAWPDGARLADVRAPTLVVHGTADPLFPLEHGRALARLVPGARLVPLDGVGHEQPPPERWDVVVPALLTHTAGA